MAWNCLEIDCFSFILLVILSVCWPEYLSEFFFKASVTLFSKLLPTVNKYLCLPVCLCFWILLWNDIFWWDLRCPCWMQDDGVLFRNFPPICCSHFISHKMHKIFFWQQSTIRCKLPTSQVVRLRCKHSSMYSKVLTCKFYIVNQIKDCFRPLWHLSMHIIVSQRSWYDVVSLKNTTRDWGSTAL